MADKSYLDILAQGVEAWNSWRDEEGSGLKPHLDYADFSGLDLSEVNLAGADLWHANLSRTNLSNADLSGANFSYANLSGANLSEAVLDRAMLKEVRLSGANLSGANLTLAILIGSVLPGANLGGANLGGANLLGLDLSEANLEGASLDEANLRRADLSGLALSEADLSEANLSEANLSYADLSGAELSYANLSEANLSYANLSNADLTHSIMVRTNLEGSTLTDCDIYGISAWSLSLEGAIQWNLNVSDRWEPAIMVDNLEVAQFVYLLVNNDKLRQVIDTITSKAVLILGRFTAERKAILDAVRDALRQRGYLPILFDFEKPASRDLTETISTLAHMARFIIADITEAKSIPQELQAIVPNLPSVPVQPLLLASEREYGMFPHFKRYPWVLETYYYDTVDEVLNSLEDKIISPAEVKARDQSE
jgi:uncharacterized protein YjbI with pentapeptide repeats